MNFNLIWDAHKSNPEATVDRINALGPDELGAFKTAVVAQSKELYPGPDTAATPALAADMSALADMLGHANAALATRNQIAEAAAALAEAADAIVEMATEDEGEEEAAEDAAEEAVVEAAPLMAAATKAPAAEVDLARLRTAAPPAPTGTDTRTGINYRATFAANVPGRVSASPVETMSDLAAAVLEACNAFPKTRDKSAGRIKTTIANFNRITPEHLRMTSDEKTNARLLADACDEKQLPGGSLVAANGWCAPSMVDYNLCPSLISQDGLWDVPTVEVDRGGLRYPTTWDYQTIAAMLSGQVLCEADLIAGTEKTCIEAPCPDWNEFRLCAIPLCVRNKILQERAWPEGVQRFIDDVLDAQPHFINGYALTQAAAMATSETPFAAPPAGAWHQVLDQLGLIVAFYRDLYRMALNSTLEVVLPHWLRQELIADKAKQLNGDVDLAETQLDAYFARRGARVQWVYDWQPLAVAQNDTFAVPDAWPDTVQALVYPAGTFFKAQRNILTLTAVYDAASLATNTYTALWAEDEFGIMQRCYRASTVDIALCVNGAMGPMIDNCATPA